MSFVTSNDRNIVDDSVKYVLDAMPNAIKRLTYIFVKYGKLIDQKYVELSQSDERRRIRNINDIRSILSLSFDKLLFALDKDSYIDFMNEIKAVENDCFCFYSDTNYKWKECVDPMGISTVKFKYLVHPSVCISRITNEGYGDLGVPMIKVSPRFRIEEKDKGDEFWYAEEKDPMTGFGIGFEKPDCDILIDITSLFDIISSFCRRSMKLSATGSREFENTSYFHGLVCREEECVNDWADEVSKILTKRISYSLVTTYLATVTKVKEFTNNEMDSIFNDILNSCRKTMLGGFDSQGQDINTGMALRHMTIDISTLLNSISYAATKDYTKRNEYCILANMITYLLTLKYETYNYKRIPFNNLNHKKLVNIADVAKTQLYLLSPETIAALQCCFTDSTFNGSTCSVKNSCFLNTDMIKTDGTYALNKRIYDTGKDFIDVFAKFIIIKKRMADAGGLNFADGNIDRIGKRYIDYKQYMKSTYNEIKVSLTNIFNRMRSVTIGKRYLTNSIMVKDDDNEVIRNLNAIVYGINTECVLNESWETNAIFDQWVNKSVDYNNPKKEYVYINPNEKISDIRKIYDVLKERECTYSTKNSLLTTAINTHGNSSSLISFWIAINEAIGFYFDSPFEDVKNSIGEIAIGYTVNSINEMAPKQDLFDSSKYTDEFKSWIPIECANRSVEDLRLAFENLKEKIEEEADESVVGGLLFSDFGGIQLAQEMSLKETELENEKLSVTTVPTPEMESFESLCNEFDEFLSNIL